MPQPLRAYLEAQADRVEALLHPKGLPAKVIGGTVGPRNVRFFLKSPEAKPPADRREPLQIRAIRPYADDLASALRVSQVTVSRTFPPDYDGEADLCIEFENPNPRPIALLNLLPQVLEDEHRQPEPLPLTTPLLGLTDAGIPLLFRLASEQVRHVLIAGQQQAGKSILLRDIALSLVLTHDPGDLQLLMIDLDAAGPLHAVAPAPHMVRQPASDLLEAREVLGSLRHLITHRQRPEPRIILLIDHADAAVADLREGVLGLVEHGFAKGIHLVLASRTPLAWTANTAWEQFFGVRIWGRGWQSLRHRSANMPTGRLLGRGDFYASGAGEPHGFRFQAAYVGEQETDRALTTYQREPHRYPHSVSQAESEARQQAQETGV